MDAQVELESVKASLQLPSASWINSSKIAKPLRGGGAGLPSGGGGGERGDISPLKPTYATTNPSTPVSGTSGSIGNRKHKNSGLHQPSPSLTYLFHMLVSSPKSLQGKRSSWYVSLLKK